MKTVVKRMIVLYTLGSVALNAGAAESPTLPEEKRGAIIGGLVGAGVGGPIGAGVGVIIGGGWLGKMVGLHRLNGELTTEISGLIQARVKDEDQYKRRITRLTRALAKAEAQEAVVDAVPIQFRTASAVLETHYRKELSALADTLARRRDARVLLSGFADRRGDADYNLKLSEERVAEVRQFLLMHGVSPSQIETRALGESMPVSETDSPEAHFFDRRVVMELINQTNSRGVAVR